jgi:hypothetical protein
MKTSKLINIFCIFCSAMDETIIIISYMCHKNKSSNIGWLLPWVHQTIVKKRPSFILFSTLNQRVLSSCLLVSYTQVDILLLELIQELNHGTSLLLDHEL